MRKEQEEILRTLKFNEMSFPDLNKKLSVGEERLESELKSLLNKGWVSKEKVEEEKIASYSITNEGEEMFRGQMEKHFEDTEES